MADAALLTLAMLLAICGMAWFALAMDVHWKQAGKTTSLTTTTARKLRSLGAISLGVSLVCCLSAEHATIAALVWVMTLSAAALLVTFTLAYRPRWLSPLAGRAT